MALAWPVAAAGQGWEVEPYGAVYLPIADLIDDDQTARELGQKTGLAFGGRATFWLLGRLGVEGGLLYAVSDAESSDGGAVEEIDASTWALSGRLILRLGLPGAPMAFLLSGGPALIGRGGDAFDTLDGTTDVGGVIGVGLRVPVTRRIGIRLDAEDYLYEVRLNDELEGREFGSRFQGDLVLSAGLTVALGG